MRKWLFLLLLSLATGVQGADWITASITFTNYPTNGATITVQGSARTWTNDVTASPGTQVQQTNSIAWSATNLLNHLTAYPAAFGHFLTQSNATNVSLRGYIGEVLAITTSGGYATVSYSTQSVTAPTIVVRQPYTAEHSSNQVFVASWSAKHLTLSTNAIDGVRLTNVVGLNGTVTRLTNGWYTNAAIDRPNITNGVANGLQVSNVVQLHGTNHLLYGGTLEGVTITNSVITNASVVHGFLLGLTNGVLTATRGTNLVGLNGTVWGLTNGFWTNGVLDNPTATNFVNYGNAIASAGLMADGTVAADSFQSGAGATATNVGATAVGAGALAGGTLSTAIGKLAKALNARDVALGSEAEASGGDSLAILTLAQALAPGAVAIGNDTIVGADHYASMALGSSAVTTTSNQIRLGASTALVDTPGRFNAASMTNNVFTGTNVNRGDWADEEVTVTSFANGTNILSATNRFIRLAAGPTAAFSLAGIQGGRNGRVLEVWNDTGQTFTLNNESGVEATAANRILTTTGADLALGTNAYVSFRYSSARSRWVVRRAD